tara:strand:+ start:193 stop:1257 length:1065 start_codon:yes stop_codon:yes gene_type:complete
MKQLLLIFLIIPTVLLSQKESSNFSKSLKKLVKYSTFYGAVTGGNSISDVDVFSVTDGLETFTEKTPFDYSIALGVRKIARFGYENRANIFYDGTEKSYGDAATIGKINGFEFLFEADLTRQQGTVFFNQDYFLRYVANRWIAKVEYVQDGLADIQYFESSERFRQKVGDKLSFNIGAVQRISEPYGYNPLDKWLLPNGSLHYTQLALEEGYTIEFDGNGGVTYLDPEGAVAAENTQVWEAVVVPTILAEYTEEERSTLPAQWNYSFVIGFDFYHYTKNFWLHSWANLMPVHLKTNSEYSYHNFNSGQWIDYSGGLIFGYKLNKSLGIFLEGKYNKYWNRSWHNFSVGVNYIIF